MVCCNRLHAFRQTNQDSDYFTLITRVRRNKTGLAVQQAAFTFRNWSLGDRLRHPGLEIGAKRCGIIDELALRDIFEAR